jgi:two-component system phosphate regulon sensor histidine kinase PhoR
MHGTLLRRIYPLYLGIILLSLIILIAYASSSFSAFYYEHMEVKLREEAFFVRNVFPPELLSDPSGAQAFIVRAARDQSSRITVILPDGKVIADSARAPDELDNHRNRPEVAAALRGREGLSRRTSESVSQELLYFAAPYPSDSNPLAVIRTAGILREPKAKLEDLYTGIGIAGFIILILTAGLSYFIVKKFSEPLAVIQRAAERFAQGDLDVRLSIDKPGEIRALAGAMNWMADQLKNRIGTIVRQKNELETILSGMTESVITLDPDLKIKSINRAAENLTGRSKMECRGKSLLEIFRSSELESFARDVLGQKASLEKTVLLYTALRARHLQAYGTKLDNGADKASGLLLVLHDITRLKQLEEIRKDFVANVSHELKTPITSIQGFVETLLDGALEDRDRAKQFLTIIENQAKRLNSIIEDLLSLSRLEQADTEIHKEETDLNPVLDSVFEVCASRAESKSIALRRSCPAGLRALVNPVLLEQAVINLLDNAVKYSPGGSEVLVALKEEERTVLISVADNGPGIPAKDLPRIFERFYRVDKTRSRNLGGTGLGLAIVKHITLAHGGTAWVESEMGKGSTFFIRIPLSGSEQSARQPG